MLRLLALTAQEALIVLAGFNALIALWSLPDRKLALVGRRRRKVRVEVLGEDREKTRSADEHVQIDLGDTDCGYALARRTTTDLIPGGEIEERERR